MQFASMPKAELHLHLDGALPPKTVLALATRNNRLHLLPSDQEQAIAEWFISCDFAHFTTVIRTIKRLFRSGDDFTLAVEAIGEQLAAQHIRYAEITVTPYTFVHVFEGLPIDDLLAGLALGKQRVRDAYGVEVRWVFDIPRNRAFADYHAGGEYVAGAAEQTLAYALRGRDYGVIGLGLGGNEVNAPPEPFAHVFAQAKQHGLKSLPHAGEGEGAASIRGAVQALQADRIGHGVRAIEDPHLLNILAERQIPLEINISCNVALMQRYATAAEHPFPILEQAGVYVTVNTDDPQLVGATLSGEYQLLADVYGYAAQDVIRIARNAFSASYAEPDLKARLLAELDTWAAGALGKASESNPD
ncbi:MAG: adenosine deaminase [Phototrophicaceae bacterium]